MKHTHRGRCNPNRECYQGKTYTKVVSVTPVTPVEPIIDPSLCKTCLKLKDKPTMFCGAETHPVKSSQVIDVEAWNRAPND